RVCREPVRAHTVYGWSDGPLRRATTTAGAAPQGDRRQGGFHGGRRPVGAAGRARHARLDAAVAPVQRHSPPGGAAVDRGPTGGRDGAGRGPAALPAGARPTLSVSLDGAPDGNAAVRVPQLRRRMTAAPPSSFAGLRVVLVAAFNRRYHRSGLSLAAALTSLGCELRPCEE